MLILDPPGVAVLERIVPTRFPIVAGFELEGLRRHIGQQQYCDAQCGKFEGFFNHAGSSDSGLSFIGHLNTSNDGNPSFIVMG
ncbi:hypothetical protein D3C86_1680860 [compost metagenome]